MYVIKFFKIAIWSLCEIRYNIIVDAKIGKVWYFKEEIMAEYKKIKTLRVDGTILDINSKLDDAFFKYLNDGYSLLSHVALRDKSTGFQPIEIHTLVFVKE